MLEVLCPSRREDSVRSAFYHYSLLWGGITLRTPDQASLYSFQGELSKVISMLIGLLLVST